MDNKKTEFNSSFSGVKVHPNAFVDPRAELHDGVIISQGAIVGPDVSIGKGTEIGPNAVISGRTQIGVNNKVFPSVFIGLEPQDLKYKGAPTEVIIGDNNTFRECVTINKATYEGVWALSWKQVCLPVGLAKPLGDVGPVQRLLWIAIALRAWATGFRSNINQRGHLLKR
jgi:hypothetical protein